MRPLRVLVVLLDAPVPFGSASARWYYVLLRGLAERGHQVTCLAVCTKSEEIEQARRLFSRQGVELRCYAPPRRGVLRKLRTLRRPFSYMFGRDIQRDLRGALRRGCDVLHLEQLWSGWLGLDHPDRAVVNVHHLYAIDLADAASGIGRELERALLLRTEQRLLRSFQHFAAVSPRLAAEVRARSPGATASFVPVALDLSGYPYLPDAPPPERPVVSLIGNVGWQPTAVAAERLVTRLWPAIKQRVPRARLEIVGWNARRLASKVIGLQDVELIEGVPDIRPYFERATVMLYAPPSGSGMKVKVLEALAFGVPVVTTRDGAEGLPAEDGVHLRQAEDDDALVAHTVDLLLDSDGRRNAQRAAGRRLVERACDPGDALDRLEAVYARVVGGLE